MQLSNEEMAYRQIDIVRVESSVEPDSPEGSTPYSYRQLMLKISEEKVAETEIQGI
jgi:hypothetical protein